MGPSECSRSSADAPIVIVHKDHPLDPVGVNAGAETATIALASALARLGRSIVVAAPLRSGTLAPANDKKVIVRCCINGVKYLDLSVDYNITEALRWCDREFPQGYHLVVASRAQALLESRAHHNTVLSRTFISHEPTAGAFGVQASIVGQVSDRVICVSQAQRQSMIDAGCDAKSIVVIPNGADLDLFLEGDTNNRDFNRLIFVGALVMDKGVHLLVEAFINLKSRYPQLTLDVYGSASMWGRENYFDIGSLAHQPGLTFHGAVSQATLANAYATAGLLVLPSIWFDSFPLTAVEAQVCGLPVLGSANGGMKEIIEHGVTGVILPQITRETLEQEIQRLMSKREALKSMSVAAAARTRNRYSWLSIADQFVSVIDEAARSRRNIQQQKQPVQPAGIGHLEHPSDRGSTSTPTLINRVGFLTTYKQQCGLATYAEYLLKQLPADNVVVLAEEVATSSLTGVDELNVRRCWKRQSPDLSGLLSVILKERLEIVHLNCHYRFFDTVALDGFLSQCREHGVRVIAHIHNPYTVDEGLKRLIAGADRVIVHTPENRLEVIANGATPGQVIQLEHGVEERSGEERAKVRERLGIPPGQKVVVCFGFVQVHKGLEEVVESIRLLAARGIDASLCIVGGPHLEDPSSREYYQALKNVVQNQGLSRFVTFVDGFVSESTVDDYLVAADAVVMNYRSQYFEASGAVARALGCGAAVITSSAPAFARLGDAVFHVTSGYPLSLALELVLTNAALNEELRAKAQEWARRYSWLVTASRMTEIYGDLAAMSPSSQPVRSIVAEPVVMGVARAGATRQLRVLMQNRGNALTHRGGDTVVMEQLAHHLRKQGCHVDVDLSVEQDPQRYDLVHLFNFATPELTEKLARRCVSAGVPYVVTTMYEDLPCFYNQMNSLFAGLQRYVNEGQPKARWAEFENYARSCAPCGRWENSWTANHAAALICTGDRERAALARDYPNARSIEIYPVGCEVVAESDGGAAFRGRYGLSDFVLCVGRLETRKNQLMLLKALEDSELPLVFIGGGFTYQPDYAACCKAYRRAGKTLFLDRVEPAMLASAYAAARVHALPSWYELPGLVSMEAARYGAQVLVADYGTPRDYFGDAAYYCSPDDAASIYNGVIDAYYAVPNRELRKTMAEYTWENAADRVEGIYRSVLSGSNKIEGVTGAIEPGKSVKAVDVRLQQAIAGIERASVQIGQASTSVGRITATVPVDDAGVSQADKLCAQGDEKLKLGEIVEAMKCYKDALVANPSAARAYRCLGVAELRRGDFAQAETMFRQALSLVPNDAKSLAGLGAAKWSAGKQEDGFRFYQQAVDANPDELAALLHLINGAYVLNRLPELERALRRYVIRNSGNVDIKYCLAGCFYKQGKFGDALAVLDDVLSKQPTHKDALELKRLLAEEELRAGRGSGVATVYSDATEQLLRTLEDAKECKRYDQVLAGANSILKLSSASAEQICLAKLLKAEVLALQGSLVESDELFRQVEGSKAWGHRSLCGRGVVAAANEHWDDAESFFSRALTVVADYDVALAGLGICFLQRGQQRQSWDYFQRALAINPENLRALLGVIQLGYPLGKLVEIERAVENYLEMHPADLSILYSYAGCLYAQGRVVEARAELQKILLFDSTHALASELIRKIESSGVSELSPAA